MSEGLMSFLCDLGSTTLLVMSVTWNRVMLIFWLNFESWTNNLYLKLAKGYIQSGRHFNLLAGNVFGASPLRAVA